jgi:hypothetical protein
MKLFRSMIRELKPNWLPLWLRDLGIDQEIEIQ